MIDVIIPVLGRPDSAQKVIDTLADPEMALFVCSPSDSDEIEACFLTGARVTVVPWEPGPGDFARKCNYAVGITDADWLLFGADDIRFEDGWDEHALWTAAQTGRRVIGTNDMANPMVKKGRHTTHPLVARSYIEEYGDFYYEGYDHQCVDVESTERALARGEFAFSPNSVVRHLHPIFDRNVQMDATYERALRNGQRDIALLIERRHLWIKDLRRAGMARR